MKKSNLIMVITMSLFFFGMFAWTVIADTPDYSDSERRVLASFPEISAESILEGDFAEGFDEYAVERFPARDMWRGIKAYASKAFLQKDNNGIYTVDGHISKLEYPMNTAMLDHAASVFSKVNELYLDSEGDGSENSIGNVYFAMIPDKNRYLAEPSGHLALDYDKLTEYMVDKMDFAEYIEIADLLEASDYYYTDSHWRQEKITDVADRLLQQMAMMNGEEQATTGKSSLGDFRTETATSDFEGVYLGQSALKWQPDTIKYLTNDAIEKAEVSLEGVEGTKTVYNMDKLAGKDPYEMFLSGNQSIVTIKNPMAGESGINDDSAASSKRLVMFRDSFGSSLAPLLIENYSEIVLVDLRYISSDLVGDYVDFQGADVLFMYSTSMLNNSLAIR